jgi:hypothetical protein
MKDRYKTSYFPMGYMDIELYTDIIDQLPAGTEIDLHKDGEPLLHPNMVWMIEYAKNKGMFVHVVTNGILLSRQKEEIVGSGLDLLTVSIIDDIPYESIESFMEYKGNRKPFTQTKNYKWLELVKRLDIPQTDGTIVRKMHNWTDDDERRDRKPCSKLLNYAAVNWDGGYSVCCVDYKRELVPFNVKNVPLDKCFEFSRMVYDWQEREVFIPPCNHCNYWEE